MGPDPNHTKSTIIIHNKNINTMKYIIFLLLITANISAQRDTTTNLLRTYSNIDTVKVGARYKVTTAHYTHAGGTTTAIDTSDTPSLTAHIDSIIVQIQQDSISFGQSLELYYTRFQQHNTYFQNAKRYLQKLWAIRP